MEFTKQIPETHCYVTATNQMWDVTRICVFVNKLIPTWPCVSDDGNLEAVANVHAIRNNRKGK